MICKVCGTNNIDNSRFCAKCGNELAPQFQRQPQQPIRNMAPVAQGTPDPAGFVERRPPVNHAPQNRMPERNIPAPSADMFEENAGSGKAFTDPNKDKTIFSSFKLENTVSSGLLVAALYALLAFVGYKAAFILLAVIWFIDKRDDKWLRQNSIKAFIIVVCFDVLQACVNVIPSFLGWINSLLQLTYDSINLSTIDILFDLLTRTVSYARFVILVVLIFRSLFKKSMWFGPADSIIRRHVR